VCVLIAARSSVMQLTLTRCLVWRRSDRDR